MNYYLELKFLPDDEISINFLWSKIYKQLHLALASLKDENSKVNIGFSFPDYRFDHKNKKGFIGEKLRIFGLSEQELVQLDVPKWLSRYLDYVHISSVKSVPFEKVTGYAVYKRKQVKSAVRLAKNDVKKERFSYENALAYHSKHVEKMHVPFVNMLSDSSSEDLELSQKHAFKIFIEKQSAEKSENQVFSTYGLSSVSSVPEF
jgi:CRISPR-associated endonuclease Csy4